MKTMEHQTLLMKFLEWIKPIDMVVISFAWIFGFLRFFDFYLLTDPSYWTVAAKAMFTAILTGLGSIIGVSSGKWLLSLIKKKFFKDKNKPS